MNGWRYEIDIRSESAYFLWSEHFLGSFKNWRGGLQPMSTDFTMAVL
jgi:hypothetical protein